MCHKWWYITRKQFTPRRDGGHVKAKALGCHSPKSQEGGSEVIKRKPLAWFEMQSYKKSRLYRWESPSTLASAAQNEIIGLSYYTYFRKLIKNTVGLGLCLPRTCRALGSNQQDLPNDAFLKRNPVIRNKSFQNLSWGTLQWHKYCIV